MALQRRMGGSEQERLIIGTGRKPRTVRRQHCFRCDTVLALEITDRIGFGGEYWWVKNGVWAQERWFGNRVKCPGCGLEGNLPMDKPLSFERMEANRDRS
ncbi:MAG: hypothetical protein V3S82_07270 [Dehalococcoidia bacterium]